MNSKAVKITAAICIAMIALAGIVWTALITAGFPWMGEALPAAPDESEPGDAA